MALLALLGKVAAAEDASSNLLLTGPDKQRSTLTIADFDALPHVKTSVAHHGAPHEFEGALLSGIMAKVGAPSG